MASKRANDWIQNTGCRRDRGVLNKTKTRLMGTKTAPRIDRIVAPRMSLMTSDFCILCQRKGKGERGKRKDESGYEELHRAEGRKMSRPSFIQYALSHPTPVERTEGCSRNTCMKAKSM
jgi:hypothetical protein